MVIYFLYACLQATTHVYYENDYVYQGFWRAGIASYTNIQTYARKNAFMTITITTTTAFPLRHHYHSNHHHKQPLPPS